MEQFLKKNMLSILLVVLALFSIVGGLIEKQHYDQQNSQYQTLVKQNKAKQKDIAQAKTERKKLKEDNLNYKNEVLQKSQALTQVLHKTDMTDVQTGGQSDKLLKQRKKELKHFFITQDPDEEIDYRSFPTKPYTVNLGKAQGINVKVFIAGGDPNRKIATTLNTYGVELNYNLLDHKFNSMHADEATTGDVKGEK